MSDKGRKKSTRTVKNLKVKSVSVDKAKQIKGGPNGHPWMKRGSTT
jgi:hypothetical protein